MKIGVIGSSGFIGTNFVKNALMLGHVIFGWDIVPSKVEYYEQESFYFYEWRDNNFEREDLLSECDGILILAAKRFTEEFSMDDYFVNIRIVSIILDRCIKANIKNIVILSTTGVYSDDNIPWKEEKSNIPANLYGASKAAIDELIKMYNQKHGLNIKSLRLAQVIGLGERKGYLFNTFIDNAIKKQPLNIWGTGAGRRQYVYIKDVISAIFAAFSSSKGGIYNVGMQGDISAYELAMLINHVFGNDGNYQVKKEKPEDLQRRCMDVTKIKEELGWESAYTVETALYDLKKIIREEKNE